MSICTEILKSQEVLRLHGLKESYDRDFGKFQMGDSGPVPEVDGDLW